MISETRRRRKANPADTILGTLTRLIPERKKYLTAASDVAKESEDSNLGRKIEPDMLVGMQGSIPGFEEALFLLPKVRKQQLALPSNLAYGEQGNQGIPPFTPLVFELEMINIIPAKPGSVMMPQAPTAPQQ